MLEEKEKGWCGTLRGWQPGRERVGVKEGEKLVGKATVTWKVGERKAGGVVGGSRGNETVRGRQMEGSLVRLTERKGESGR